MYSYIDRKVNDKSRFVFSYLNPHKLYQNADDPHDRGIYSTDGTYLIRFEDAGFPKVITKNLIIFKFIECDEGASIILKQS